VEFPYAGHSVIGTTDPVTNLPPETCGQLVTRTFAADPSATLDTSCAGRSTPPDLYGWQDLSVALYGTTNMWENDGMGIGVITPAAQAAADGFYASMERTPLR
jgi:hypothetical protein